MNEKGVWRTIRGRRVFIRDGEDLESAMKRSGKFDNLKRRNVQMEQAQKKIDKLGKKNTELYKKNGGFADTGDKEKNKQVDKAHKQWLKNAREANELKDMYSDYSPLGWGKDTYNNPKEYTGDTSKLEGKHIAGRETRAREIDKINSDESKEMYNSKEYAKWLSMSYMADGEYEDKITPKYVQDIDAGRYGNMSDEEAIKNWIDGGADIVYTDDAEKQLKAWGIPVKNDDAYGTYKNELAKQLTPIYKSDKQLAESKKLVSEIKETQKMYTQGKLASMSLTKLKQLANEYNVDTKGKSKKQLLSALISMFNK